MDDADRQQLKDQEERWDSRASSWDKEIQDEDSYVNFENGYEEFLAVQKELLNDMGNVGVGIDIGCGSGVPSAMLANYVSTLYLLDLSEKMLEEAKKKVPGAILLHTTATEIPLDDRIVDVVISRGVVVSHLPHSIYMDFFKEVQRITKDGAVLLFDFMSNMKSADFVNQSPKISFSEKEIEEILTSHEFTNITFYGEPINRVVRVSAVRTERSE